MRPLWKDSNQQVLRNMTPNLDFNEKLIIVSLVLDFVDSRFFGMAKVNRFESKCFLEMYNFQRLLEIIKPFATEKHEFENWDNLNLLNFWIFRTTRVLFIASSHRCFIWNLLFSCFRLWTWRQKPNSKQRRTWHRIESNSKITTSRKL